MKRKVGLSIKKNYIDSVEEFYCLLENVFHTTEFQTFYNRYLHNSKDVDIASLYFIMYYIACLHTGKDLALDTVKELIRNPSSRRNILHFYQSTLQPTLNLLR